MIDVNRPFTTVDVLGSLRRAAGLPVRDAATTEPDVYDDDEHAWRQRQARRPAAQTDVVTSPGADGGTATATDPPGCTPYGEGGIS